MTRKPRDRKAEYARRVRNLEEMENRGYSRSQLRGHARKKIGELTVSEIKKHDLPPWIRVLPEQGQTVVRLPRTLEPGQRQSVLDWLRSKGNTVVRYVYRHPGEQSHGATTGWLSIRTEPDRVGAEHRMGGTLHYPRREERIYDEEVEEVEIDDEYDPSELYAIIAV